LQVVSLDTSDRVLVGGEFEVTWEVRNTGGATPDRQIPWTDYVYLSRDGFLDRNSDHYLGQVNRETPLGANESYSVTRNYRLPRGLSGLYHVIVVTDGRVVPGNRGIVLEGSETNNALRSARVASLRAGNGH
jgi:hypothetical protein